MHSVRHDYHDRGSIPMALLVIIALSAVLGALVVTAVASGDAAQFDQEYAEVIQAADAGVQEGTERVVRGLTSDELTADPSSAPTPSGFGDLDGVAYTWTAQKTDDLTWTVTATGSGPDVDRVVEVQLVDRPLFFVAAFADRGFRMTGGNGADSFGDGAWMTGNGLVGTNERIEINGSTRVNGVQLYDFAGANADLSRCSDDGAPDDCADVQTLPDAEPPSARIEERMEVGDGGAMDTGFIDDFRSEGNCPQPEPLGPYEAATYDGGSGVLGAPATTTVYCFTDFTANRDITVQGIVEVYVYGDLVTANDTDVNCPAVGCPAAPNASTSVYPDASALTFYVADSGDPADPSIVNIGNHNNIVAGIYAPTSNCISDQGSNAQTQIFGSLICGEINNQGGWKFHYDDRLLTRGTGVYTQDLWREQ